MTLPSLSESIHLCIYMPLYSISLLQGNKLLAAKESFAAARQGLRAALRRSLWWNVQLVLEFRSRMKQHWSLLMLLNFLMLIKTYYIYIYIYNYFILLYKIIQTTSYKQTDTLSLCDFLMIWGYFGVSLSLHGPATKSSVTEGESRVPRWQKEKLKLHSDISACLKFIKIRRQLFFGHNYIYIYIRFL